MSEVVAARSAEPTHHEATATESAASDSLRISQVELRARSHDLELLISLASILALLAIPSFILGWLQENLAGLEPWLARLAILGAVFANSLSYSLAIMFCLHVLMRAIWIASIGLDTHFSEARDWRKINFVGPISFAMQKEAGGSRSTQINQLDRICTTVFVLGITLICITGISGVSGVTTVLLIQAVESFVPQLSRPLTGLITGAIGTLLVSWLFAAQLDRYYGKKGQPVPARLLRVMTPILRSQNRGLLRLFNRMLQPLFADRMGMAGYYAITVLFLIVSIFVGINIATATTGGRFDEAIEVSLEQGRIAQNYAETGADHSNRMSTQPRTTTLISQSSVVKINLPFVWMRDHESMVALCGPSYRSELVSCGQKYFSISRNDAAVLDAVWLLSGNRERGSLSLDVLLTLPETGLHRIKIHRQRQLEKKRGLLGTRPLKNTETYIPIYYTKSP